MDTLNLDFIEAGNVLRPGPINHQHYCNSHRSRCTKCLHHLHLTHSTVQMRIILPYTYTAFPSFTINCSAARSSLIQTVYCIVASTQYHMIYVYRACYIDAVTFLICLFIKIPYVTNMFDISPIDYEIPLWKMKNSTRNNKQCEKILFSTQRQCEKIIFHTPDSVRKSCCICQALWNNSIPCYKRPC